MKNKLIETEGQLNLSFYCPGCKCHHGIASRKYKLHTGPVWDWNGSMCRPTFSPSLRVQRGIGIVCHSFIKDGFIQYLNDCTHELSGKTVEIPDV